MSKWTPFALRVLVDGGSSATAYEAGGIAGGAASLCGVAIGRCRGGECSGESLWPVRVRFLPPAELPAELFGDLARFRDISCTDSRVGPADVRSIYWVEAAAGVGVAGLVCYQIQGQDWSRQAKFRCGMK